MSDPTEIDLEFVRLEQENQVLRQALLEAQDKCKQLKEEQSDTEVIEGLPWQPWRKAEQLEQENAALKQQLALAQMCCDATVGDCPDAIVDGFAKAKGWLSPAEAARLQAESDHMAYCRSILSVPNDDVLAESIKQLQARLNEAIALLRDGPKGHHWHEKVNAFLGEQP